MRELKVDAKLEKLDEVLGYIDEILAPYEPPIKVDVTIHVAVEEIFVNIAHYAYPENPDGGWAILQTDVEKNAEGVPVFSITFIDGGIPYDPLAKPDPDITLSAEEREIGGLGIYMVKKSMDEMSYERKDDKNVLTLRKALVDDE